MPIEPALLTIGIDLALQIFDRIQAGATPIDAISEAKKDGLLSEDEAKAFADAIRRRVDGQIDTFLNTKPGGE